MLEQRHPEASVLTWTNKSVYSGSSAFRWDKGFGILSKSALAENTEKYGLESSHECSCERIALSVERVFLFWCDHCIITLLIASRHLETSDPLQIDVRTNRVTVTLTSAAGIPSGGRHCKSTSCSRETSFPNGSWSNVFLRSAEEGKRDILIPLPTAKWEMN